MSRALATKMVDGRKACRVRRGDSTVKLHKASWPRRDLRVYANAAEGEVDRWRPPSSSESRAKGLGVAGPGLPGTGGPRSL